MSEGEALRPRAGQVIEDEQGQLWIAVEDAADRPGGSEEDRSPDVLLLPALWDYRMLIEAEGAFEKRGTPAAPRTVIRNEALNAALARRATAQSRLGPRPPRAATG